jgi:hypothetical protein
VEWHRAASSWSPLPGCSIWQLPAGQAEANIAAAEARLAEFTAELNRKLRAQLP